MKTQILLLLLIASFVGVGCSNKQATAVPPVATDPVVEVPVDPGTPNGGGTDGSLASSSGDTVDFVPVSREIYNSFVGVRPLNSPKNIKISVNLSQDESYRFKGNVKISYEDNGEVYPATFESGTEKNYQHSTLKDNDKYEYQHNYWFKNGGNTVFNGYFQDKLGAIIIVVDKAIDQGDGQGSAYVSGSVYFKNFPQINISYNPQTGRTNEQPWERKCWFIYEGPYMCSSATVTSKSGIYPTTAEGYRKLGTFSGMAKAKAFNL